MASLWTPEGEHRVSKDTDQGAPVAPASGSTPPASELFGDEGALDAEAIQAELLELQRELLSAPVETVIANHCYGLFQLAALHLSQKPPDFDDARLAIDALAAVIETLGERLKESAGTLRDALAQIRLAFVQIQAAQAGENGQPATSEQPAP